MLNQKPLHRHHIQVLVPLSERSDDSSGPIEKAQLIYELITSNIVGAIRMLAINVDYVTPNNLKEFINMHRLK